ncbi:MAG: hypothetical protein L3K01_07230, partial [Thermoplasmata archaeon]|nr:hypothetical protein [Thermoplasmata archaeon]
MVGGTVMLIVGLGLTVTIIGAIFGVPLILLGIVFILRGARPDPPPVVYYQQPPPPLYYAPPPVVVNGQQPSQPSLPLPPPPPQVMFRCRYCQSV